MIASPSYTNIYSFVTHEFNQSRMRALRGSLIAKILGKNQALKSLSEISYGEHQNKRYMGVQNISTEKIMGTVSRNEDFDKDFRPRKKHLQHRWVNAFIRLNSDGWTPIVVHRVGDAYYVEDGHHRVSVARSVGMLFIEAEVWDHPSRVVQPCTCRSSRRLESKPLCACAAD